MLKIHEDVMYEILRVIFLIKCNLFFWFERVASYYSTLFSRGMGFLHKPAIKLLLENKLTNAWQLIIFRSVLVNSFDFTRTSETETPMLLPREQQILIKISKKRLGFRAELYNDLGRSTTRCTENLNGVSLFLGE